MNGLPEEILRCFRADFTEHLTYEELQHLHLLKRTFELKKRKTSIKLQIILWLLLKRCGQSLLKVDITKK